MGWGYTPVWAQHRCLKSLTSPWRVEETAWAPAAKRWRVARAIDALPSRLRHYQWGSTLRSRNSAVTAAHVEQEGVPFALLSDECLELARTLGLPTAPRDQ